MWICHIKVKTILQTAMQKRIVIEYVYFPDLLQMPCWTPSSQSNFCYFFNANIKAHVLQIDLHS